MTSSSRQSASLLSRHQEQLQQSRRAALRDVMRTLVLDFCSFLFASCGGSQLTVTNINIVHGSKDMCGLERIDMGKEAPPIEGWSRLGNLGLSMQSTRPPTLELSAAVAMRRAANKAYALLCLS